MPRAPPAMASHVSARTTVGVGSSLCRQCSIGPASIHWNVGLPRVSATSSRCIQYTLSICASEQRTSTGYVSNPMTSALSKKAG